VTNVIVGRSPLSSTPDVPWKRILNQAVLAVHRSGRAGLVPPQVRVVAVLRLGLGVRPPPIGIDRDRPRDTRPCLSLKLRVVLGAARTRVQRISQAHQTNQHSPK
jgi:hypothetical protein